MEKVSNIIPYFLNHLSDISNKREIASWAYISIEHVLGYNRSKCIINANNNITDADKEKFFDIVSQLKTNKPLQHILEKTEFYNLTFKVNEHTLIPRPETEELVDWILKEKFNSVLDIGTGSGCIAISIAKNSNTNVSAIDVSKNALEVAMENARLNNVNINFIQQNILETEQLEKVDLIVSNPPYVLESEKKEMKSNVLDFEPHLALFVDNNSPLIFYKKIADLAYCTLNKGGKLFFEINEQFGEQTKSMLKNVGFVNIELKKDINDKDRMIKATKK